MSKKTKGQTKGKTKNKASSGVKDMAADTWEKLEHLFAARVATVLNAMQIPSHDDVQDLAERVAQLTRAVEKLTGEPVAKTRSKGAGKNPTSKKKASKKKRSKVTKAAASAKRSGKKTAAAR